MNGSDMALKAKEMADGKRAEEKAKWEAKMARIEDTKIKLQVVRAELNQLMSDFVANAPGMRWDNESHLLYVGNCKVAQVNVYSNTEALYGLQWSIDVYPQWPRHDRDEVINASSMEEFKDVFTQFVSRFF